MEENKLHCSCCLLYLFFSVGLLYNGPSSSHVLVPGSKPPRIELDLCPSVCRCKYTNGNLISADCSNRGLKSAPSGLHKKSLLRLTLSHNDIHYVNFADFDTMPNLQYLDLSFNNLIFIQPANGYRQCMRLREIPPCCIDLQINNDSMPASQSSGKTKHTNNRKSGHYYYNNNLRNYTDTLIGDSVGGVIRSSGCIASYYCQNQKARPRIRIKKLRTLLLHHNKLTNLSACQFSEFSHLQALDLSYNFIISNELNLHKRSFAGLLALRTLNLKSNRLDSLPDNIFQDLQNLIELNIQDNNFFTDYPDMAVGRLVNLQKLHLDGMLFPSVLGFGFQNVTRLSLLDFVSDNCKLSKIHDNFFSNISTKNNLTILMNKCNVKYFEEKVFSHLPTLVKLDISSNEHLYCDNVYRASVSFPSTIIKDFDFSRTNDKKFLRLTRDTFKYMKYTHMETLKMSHNNILLIDLGVTNMLPKTLKLLDISSNNIIQAYFVITVPFLINVEILIVSEQNKYQYNDYINIDHNEFGRPEICHRIRNNKKALGINDNSTSKNKRMPGVDEDAFQHGVSIQLNEALTILQEKGKSINGNYNITLGQWKAFVHKLCHLQVDIHFSRLNEASTIITKDEFDRMLKAISSYNDNSYPFQTLFSSTLNEGSLFQYYTLPRNLRKLYANDLKLGYNIPHFAIEYNTVLQYVNASNNNLWCFKGPIIGLNPLRYLDLSRNIAFAINQVFFVDLKNIEHLILSYNKLATSFQIDVEGEILSYLGKLRILKLDNNMLRVLHQNSVSNNYNLTHLFLHHNNLQDLPNIGHLKKLQLLDISFNSFKHLRQETRDELDSIISLNSNLSVNMYRNPFTCDCDSLGFLLWLAKTKVHFKHKNKYTCDTDNGTISLVETVRIVPKLWRSCNSQHYFLISIILCLSLIFVLTSLALTSYFQYRLLFYIYLSKQRFFNHLYEIEDHRLRDVFLVYDDQEIVCRHHIINVFLPNLSNQGLTYHMSEIGLDTPSVGRSVREVVEESVLGGRKTVVLLTPQIFDDEEKQLEVGMAKIVEEMSGCPKLIFLATEKLVPRELPVSIYRLLRVGRILWYLPDDQQFWKKLAREIRS